MTSEVKIGNIVRNTRNGQIYEIVMVNGLSSVGKPINTDKKSQLVALLNEEIEVLLDEENDAFNVLFKK